MAHRDDMPWTTLRDGLRVSWQHDTGDIVLSDVSRNLSIQIDTRVFDEVVKALLAHWRERGMMTEAQIRALVGLSDPEEQIEAAFREGCQQGLIADSYHGIESLGSEDLEYIDTAWAHSHAHGYTAGQDLPEDPFGKETA